MKILAIHRYFWPDSAPYASFLREIGKTLVEDGHHVEILTAQPSYNSSGPTGRRPPHEYVDGLSVSRVDVLPENRIFPGQLLNMIVFPLQVAVRILFGRRRDAIMCSTAPQVTLGFVVSLAARIRRAKFYYHCMDLHPEIGRLSGEFSNPLVYRVLAWMDRSTMRRAHRVIVLSDDMRASVLDRDPALRDSIVVLNNFALPDFAPHEESPIEDPDADTLRIVFTGNLGRFQGLEHTVQALGLLPVEDAHPVEIVFMGEGKAKADLIEEARKLRERTDISIRFVSQGVPSAAKALMRSADLGLVSLVPEVVRYAYPSKTASYLAEGVPLLVACEPDSELARTVVDKELGLTVPARDTQAMAEAIQEARKAHQDGTVNRWGSTVKSHAREEFGTDMLLDRWSRLFARADTSNPAPVSADVTIIVGAPRSGTNMLRDVLTSLEGFETWPCDEINLMWKHGNLNTPHDELTPRNATPKVQRYLRKQFDKLAQRTSAHTVVEKTCATSLRVGFAHAVFPEAKFIFIRRDGVDAAPSAMKRWNSEFDPSYTLKKVRWVPLSDFPRHLWAFVSKTARRRVANAGRNDDDHLNVATWWGPKPADFRQLQNNLPLDEIAIRQWQRCVENARRDLAEIAPESVLEVVYEQFVRDPENHLRRILEFLGRSDKFQPSAISDVSATSVGKGRGSLGAEAAGRLDAVAWRTLVELGYV